MREFRRASEAIAVPSRAQELKMEMKMAARDDLKEMLERTKNKSKRRKLKAEILNKRW